MKKFLISAVFILGFGVYATYNYLTNNSSVPSTSATVQSGPVTITTQTNNTVDNAPPPNPTSAPSESTAPSPVVTPDPVPNSVPTSSSAYKDGTYTGSAANAYYGNIQVRATITGGKITNVTFLQYPNDRSTSRFINQQAMPQLRAEALQAQSANVDGVSGASDSSAAFNESLASALFQAK